MELPISLALVFLVLGLLLVVWNSTRKDKHPFIVLAGFALITFAVVSYLTSGSGLFSILRGFFVDAGIALLVISGILALRKGRSKPFFALGLMFLGISFLIVVIARLFGSGAEIPNSFLLELGPDDNIEEVAPILNRYDVRYERAFPSVTLDVDEDLAQYFLVFGDPSSFDQLMADLRNDTENVDHVELNRIVSLNPPDIKKGSAPSITRSVMANDPLIAQQWAIDAIHGHEAHQLLSSVKPAKKAIVAILDTGVDDRHEDLRAAFRVSPGTDDGHGHGTHCAGIAGALANNGIGVTSLNWGGRFVEVTSYKALPYNGSGSLESIAQAIIDATNGDADVISMSLGSVSPVPPKVVVEAVEFAQARGVIVAASAGNANEDAFTHMPSNIDGVIAVAAVDQNLQKARFSNTVSRLSRPLASPGVDILSLKANGDYVSMSGTSMATPMVAGLLGVLRALHPDLSAQQAYDILHQSGQTVADSKQIGRVIDAEAAIKAVLPMP